MAVIKLLGDKQKQHAIELLSNTAVGKNFECIIRKCKRSAPQNKTFHLWCTQIAVASGCYSMEQVKKLMKKQYGVWEIVEVYGVQQIDAKSTADYTLDEMSKLMTGVCSFADAYGIELTDPEAMNER
jgi:hypothetical protein